MLDQLHEDVNLVTHKQYTAKPEGDGKNDCETAKAAWRYGEPEPSLKVTPLCPTCIIPISFLHRSCIISISFLCLTYSSPLCPSPCASPVSQCGDVEGRQRGQRNLRRSAAIANCVSGLQQKHRVLRIPQIGTCMSRPFLSFTPLHLLILLNLPSLSPSFPPSSSFFSTLSP